MICFQSLPILDSDLPTHDSSAFFHKFTTLLSIHNSFTPSSIPTASAQPFCHNTAFASTHNHPSNWLHFPSVDVSFPELRDWTTSSNWHCTDSTHSRRVHFHRVRPVYLNGLLPSVASRLGLWSSYAWQFSFFNIFTALLSIHNCFTPTSIPIASTQPFCHNTTFTSTHNHPSNFLHFQPVDVSFSRLRLDLPTVDIAQLAHAAGEYIFTIVNPYI